LNLVRSACYLFFFLTAIFALASAQQPQDRQASQSSSSAAANSKRDSDRVIMKVGGVPVTEAEFESTIGDIEPKGGGEGQEHSAQKKRDQLGDDYATVLMLSQLALANHLDSSPAIRSKLAVARMHVLSDAQFANLLSETKPSHDEISKYYDAHKSDFDTVQLRRLFIWKVGGGSKNSQGLPPAAAKARAAEILQESASGGDTMKFAQMLSQSNQGFFDPQPLPFVRGQLFADLDKVAFTMKVGTWAVAEDTPDRMILLYLNSREPQPLPRVQSQVERLVQGEKMQAKLEELKKKTGIWLDKQYFSSGSAVANEPGEQRPVSEAPSANR
jgi:parvulin-like peptidyl-prolyl isomerase